MKRKYIIFLSLVLGIIVLILGIRFLNRKLDFLSYFATLFDLGDVNYEFPEVKEHQYNISDYNGNIIVVTTSKNYFLEYSKEDWIYKDIENESEFSVKIENKNSTLDSYYNSVYGNILIDEGEVIKKTLDNGYMCAEFSMNGYFHMDVILEIDEYFYTIAFICESQYKEKYMNSFSEWANNIKIQLIEV